MQISRRGFIAGLAGLIAAPAIIRTPGLLMPIRDRAASLSPTESLLDELKRRLNATLSQYIFEPNDAFTRHSITLQAQIYLQGFVYDRRVNDYLIICDQTNNTPGVINSNAIRADLYVRPSKSIETYVIQSEVHDFSRDWRKRIISERNI